MKYVVILNDPPYGTEKSFNGLRLALGLAHREEVELKIFLMADAVACGKAGQKTPQGYYNLERMIAILTDAGVTFSACGGCLDARGIPTTELAPGIQRGTMEDLTDWTLWADKVIVY